MKASMMYKGREGSAWLVIFFGRRTNDPSCKTQDGL